MVVLTIGRDPQIAGNSRSVELPSHISKECGGQANSLGMVKRPSVCDNPQPSPSIFMSGEGSETKWGSVEFKVGSYNYIRAGLRSIRIVTIKDSDSLLCFPLYSA